MHFVNILAQDHFLKRPVKKMHLKKLGLCTCMGIARCLIMPWGSTVTIHFNFITVLFSAQDYRTACLFPTNDAKIPLERFE